MTAGLERDIDMKLGTKTGSLINHVYGRTQAPKPEVGMGATELRWTDRRAGTIIKVSPSGKTVTLQYDISRRDDTNGMSESQRYTYTPDPEGCTEVFRLNKAGSFRNKSGNGLMIGKREEYYDYSF